MHDRILLPPAGDDPAIPPGDEFVERQRARGGEFALERQVGNLDLRLEELVEPPLQDPPQ